MTPCMAALLLLMPYQLAAAVGVPAAGAAPADLVPVAEDHLLVAVCGRECLLPCYACFWSCPYDQNAVVMASSCV